MAAEHWTDRVVERLTQDLERSKVAMKAMIGRPVLRRPNTSQLMADAMANPQALQYDPTGRDTLMGYLQDRYGEASRNLLPYLGIEEE